MKGFFLLILFFVCTAAVVPGQPPRLIVRGDDMDIRMVETRAIHHIGYEDVAIGRQGVTDAWISKKVKDAILKFNIELISYKDLKIKP